jgi:3'(2'), 5'-bisphosphate nucleotidase
MINLENKEVQFAIDAVRQACKLVNVVEAEMVNSALIKTDRSPVTVADFTVQALIGSMLQKAFPEDPLVGEEDTSVLLGEASTATLNQVTAYLDPFISHSTPEAVCGWIEHGSGDVATRYWTLDPIDGTKGFLRGDQYAVALALVVDGLVQIGVLGCPKLGTAYPEIFDTSGSLIIAVRGQGTWSMPIVGTINIRRMQVSNRKLGDQARIFRSYEKGHTNISQIDEFSTELGTKTKSLSMDSQAKYAVLAAGQGELLLRLLSEKQPDYKEKVWDQAAGSLIIEEAGGKITDLDGKALDFTAGRLLVNNRGVLASNQMIHSQALETLRKIRA